MGVTVVVITVVVITVVVITVVVITMVVTVVPVVPVMMTANAVTTIIKEASMLSFRTRLRRRKSARAVRRVRRGVWSVSYRHA